MYLKEPIEIRLPVADSCPFEQASPIMPPATPTYRYRQAQSEREWEAQRYALEREFYRLLGEERAKREAAEAEVERLTADLEIERKRVHELGVSVGFDLAYRLGFPEQYWRPKDRSVHSLVP